MSLDELKTGIMALVVIALIAGAAALALSAFQDDLGDNACTGTGNINNGSLTFNVTDHTCRNSTGEIHEGLSTAFNSSQEGLAGISNATSYLSTIGVMIGIAALLAVVVAAFYFMGRR